MNSSYRMLVALFASTIALAGCFDKGAEDDAQLQSLRDQISGRHQNENKVVHHDPQRVLATTAGLKLVSGQSLSESLKTQLDTRWVDFSSHTLVNDPKLISQYQQQYQQGLIHPHAVDPTQNLAKLNQLEQVAPLYLKKATDGRYSQVIIPIRGKGYFAMLYGYLALDLDTLKVARIRFYENAETPALGGQIMTNEKWMQQFPGKLIYRDGVASFHLTKGKKKLDDYSVDGISGATHTSQGVEDLINFWCGDQGYGPILKTLQQRAKAGTL